MTAMSACTALPIRALPIPQPPADLGGRAELTRQRHAEIHALLAEGIGTTAICHALDLDGKTVRRYKLAATADELLTEPIRRTRNSTSTPPAWSDAGGGAAPTLPG
ncbi:hypothetical protein Daura_31060 [Dactylosporangium aurantiacum]|uniref:Uncharacterized protein n=1 Tax=Dactylosporangium aurantiacum TaxID=35754 RepID=A0A9Q9MEA3_9ACTN|nr:hypothetical protein [Dactylosporangium aurantiacum]MDG6107282.1 hypothetical protein [Dactylosporangium aurantiacum]UWZ51190.1 hypothetical protein Daura_31060 [Dactylosporangium aurantiacum]